MPSEEEQLEKLRRLAEKQFGVIAVWQAGQVGLSRDQFERLVSGPAFKRVHRGMYRAAGVPSSFEQKVWQACLDARGVASHRTAAFLWGLDGFEESEPLKIDLLVTFDNKRKARNARVHRSRTFVKDHRCLHEGVPCTTLARTVADLSQALPSRSFELALASALRQEPALYEQLETLLASMPAATVEQLKKLRPVLSAREQVVDSALEVTVRGFLRRAKFPAPKLQHEVFDGNAFIGRFDFAWPDNDPPVVLQAHGERYHGNTAQWRRDLQQASELNELGWRLLQCTKSDVEKRPLRLAQMLRRALGGHRGDGRYSEKRLRDPETSSFSVRAPKR